MLTARVSLERVPFEGSASERMRLWLWERHSVRFGIGIALLLGVGLCLLAFGVALLADVPMLGPPRDIDGIPTLLVAAAGYGGALFGFLQAVAIFAVQLRSQQDTAMLPLTPLIARRYFTFLILGGVAGVTIANLLASFAAPVLPVGRSALAALTWINLLAVPFATLAAFWYLASIVAEAGEADMDIALPVLRATMRAQALADARNVAMLNAYGAALESAGLQYNPFAASRLGRAGRSTDRIEIAKSGVIHDVDCVRLRHVGRLLTETSPPSEAAVTIAFDQEVHSSEHALILVWGSGGTGPAGTATQSPLNDNRRRRLGSTLNASYFARRQRSHWIAKDVRNFLKRFETTLKTLARDGRHVELEARFADFQKLLGAWLEVAPPGAAPPERPRFLAIIDRFGGPLEIEARSTARAAALSGDSSTVVVFADATLLAAHSCLRQQQPRLLEEFLKALVFLYYQCVQRDDLADALGERLDSGLHSLFMAMRSQVPGMDDGDGNSHGDETAVLDVALRFALSLVHAAIRYEQTKHASYFVERIFEHRKYKHRPHHPSNAAPVTMSVEAVFDYVAVVLVGWSLHILQSGACQDSDAAKAVLDAARGQLPSIPVLIAEWERRAGEQPDASLDARLGVARWDIRDWNREFRAGVGEFRSGGEDWIRLGFRAALLCSKAHFWGDTSTYFAGPPKRFVWEAGKEREALEKLAEDEWLGIPEDQRQRRVDAAMDIIQDRAQLADADYLRYVLDTPLSEARVARLREEAIKAYEEKRAWQRAFRAVGLSSESPSLSPLRTRWGIWVPREYLLDDSNWASGFGEVLGEEAAAREAMALIHMMETIAQRGDSLDALSRLPEVVRPARRRLSNAGFNPNVLILPREDRFAGALFRKPLWQVEGGSDFGEARIGVWEQMHVLRFPHTNPQSILLIDTTRVLTEHEIGGARERVSVWIDENPDNEEVAEKKEKAAEALESGDAALSESSSIHVLAWMEAIPDLAVADSRGMIAIDILESDGLYALPAESSLYHRASCPAIEQGHVERLLRLPPGCPREPCGRCRPDRWSEDLTRSE